MPQQGNRRPRGVIDSQTLVYFAVGLLFAVGAGISLHNGSFTTGGRHSHSGSLVTRDGDPTGFWFGIGVMVIAFLACVGKGIQLALLSTSQLQEDRQRLARQALSVRPTADPAGIHYILNIAGREHVRHPTPEQIRFAVMALSMQKGDAFLVLNASDGRFIQTSGDKRLGFDLESQDGESHTRAKREYSAEEIIKVLVAYTQGETAWKANAEWEAV